MSKVLLQTKSLTRRLSGEVPVTLVQDADVTIDAGEFVAITGPSGSGKSSLLYLLGLLDKPSSGEILLEGEETTLWEEDIRAARRLSKLGFVFQFHFLLPEFTALENVMLPMQRLGELTPQAMRARAQDLLAQLGLASQMHKLPKQLSGGQSQRVSIARALANDPTLILADEPTGNLDTASSANVREILHKLTKDYKRTVVVVTHDPEFAKTADRIIHIVDGKIVS